MRGILKPIKGIKRKIMIIIQLKLKGNWRTVTARTNASKPKFKQMLYYKDTKLRSRRKSREGHVYIYSAKIPLTRAPISVAYNSATISYRGSTPAPSHYPPLLKKPALRLYISPSLEEKEEKKKKFDI